MEGLDDVAGDARFGYVVPAAVVAFDLVEAGVRDEEDGPLAAAPEIGLLEWGVW